MIFDTLTEELSSPVAAALPSLTVMPPVELRWSVRIVMALAANGSVRTPAAERMVRIFFIPYFCAIDV
jgi:hypothetical protein